VGVRVRLSPEEAEAVQAAAARTGLSVGAWVADAAVSRARSEGQGEAKQAALSSWRELVAALVVLRTEVVSVWNAGGAVVGDLLPVVQLGPASDAGEPVRAENRDIVPYQRLCGHTADRPRSRRPAPAQHDLPLWPSDSRT
jgi:hypothetical protein